MSETPRARAGAPDPADWDPSAADVLADQRAAYDALRSRCPVARDPAGGWTLFRHADVVRTLHDPDGFSNVVSRHLSVPIGTDPPTHTVYRRLIEPYFDDALVAAFEPGCRQIAATLVDEACARQNVDVMADLALPFAARAQCAYLGWRWIWRRRSSTGRSAITTPHSKVIAGRSRTSPGSWRPWWPT